MNNIVNGPAPTALVTGASRGIGRAIARKLASKKYDLILTCSRSMDDLLSLSDSLRSEYGIRCVPCQCDMGDPQAVEHLFAGISDLDVLINNAGISHIGLLQDMTAEEWNRILSVNLSSCFYTSKKAIPLFLHRQYGRIINISSVWGSVGASAEAAYSASKGGVNTLTRALAKELAPSGISVNALAFGCIDTDMNRCFSPEERLALEEEIPAGRYGTPEEAAEAVYHLLQMPVYLTGQVITVDGGWC